MGNPKNVKNKTEQNKTKQNKTQQPFMSSLSNLKCLVTGASSGIGKATCIALSAEGATVIGVGRNESSLEELRASGQILGYVVEDLSSVGACERVVTEALSKLGGELTTLVNNAGVLRGG